MYIDVYGSFNRASDRELRERSVVVIDLLRATTCIVEAMVNGARKVIPVEDVTEAIAVSRTLDRSDRVLAGEREGKPLSGFDIGNSPREFAPRVVGGKTVVISTTNGTAAIQKARDAKILLIGALLNRKAVAKKIAELNIDVTLLCAGTDGKISNDDIYCAGAIISALRDMGQAVESNDLGMICELVYKTAKVNPEFILNSYHCRKLIDMGYGADVDFCLQEDVTDCVPECIGGVIS